MQLGDIKEQNIPDVWLLQTYDEPVYQAGHLTMEENNEIKKAAANKWWQALLQADFMGDKKSQKLRIKFTQNTGTKKEPKTQETWLLFHVPPTSKKDFNEMEKMVEDLSE